MNLQQHQRPTLLALVVFALLGAAGLLKLPSVVASSRSATAADVTQTRIARAMSAGPADIARSAKIIDTDAHGKTLVVREGSNGFTWMPGDPYVIGEPAMCVDAASLQWFADAKAHKPRPNDTTSPAIRVGPHWMIMWPFDPKTTGLPTTHRDHGAYIMWAGSPYAHMHVMGRP